MGYFGKLEEKLIAIELRKKGFSYNQILKKVSVSKDTISRWCRDIVITPEQMETLLKRKLIGGEKGRLIAAKLKHDKRIVETVKELKNGEKDVGKLSKRDRFISGIALYAGEGGKKSLGFANSDPKIIKFMMGWFREFCNVPEEKLRGSIWIHDNLDAEEAKIYWSNLTKIPTSQFYKTYIAKNKVDTKKVRKNIHSFGVFSITILSIQMHRRIMGWMSGILGSKLV